MNHRLRGTPQNAPHLHLLSSRCAAVYPKSQVGKAAGIHWRNTQVKGLPVSGSVVRCHTDGIRAVVDRADVGPIHCRPTPVRPAIFKLVVVNYLVSTRRQLKCQDRYQPARPLATCPASKMKGFHRHYGKIHQKSCQRCFWGEIHQGDANPAVWPVILIRNQNTCCTICI